jgi:hypothetical protein
MENTNPKPNTTQENDNDNHDTSDSSNDKQPSSPARDSQGSSPASPSSEPAEQSWSRPASTDSPKAANAARGANAAPGNGSGVPDTAPSSVTPGGSPATPQGREPVADPKVKDSAPRSPTPA